MHLGFALFRYFPFGGLQRDMLAIAQCCVDMGHRVTVFCREWEGDRPEGIAVKILPVNASSNHLRDARFAALLPAQRKAEAIDRLVGFNKMPGLDVYYAADSCFAAKVFEERSWFYRFTARARSFMALEKAVFSTRSAAKILLISAPEAEVYRRYYKTPQARMQLLPPGIRRDRVMTKEYKHRRETFRAAQGWGEAEKVILFVGSGFQTKGLDRAIQAFAAAQQTWPNSRLLVLGQDKADAYKRKCKQLGVAEKVHFLGGVENVVDYLWAGDLLIHPAYRENTGTVLLEAMVSGLPVLTTAACGYAAYVESWEMGAVVSNPFKQSALEQLLLELLGQDGAVWRQRGRKFAAGADIYSMPERAAELIVEG